MKKAAALALVALVSLGGLTACDSKKDCPKAEGINSDTVQALIVPEKGGSGGGGGGHASGGGGHAAGGESGGSHGTTGESSTSGKSGTSADEGVTGTGGGTTVVPHGATSGSSDCKQ